MVTVRGSGGGSSEKKERKSKEKMKSEKKRKAKREVVVVFTKFHARNILYGLQSSTVLSVRVRGRNLRDGW